MKYILALILSTFTLSNVNSQTTKVSSNVGSVAYNGIVVPQKSSLSAKTQCFFAVAFNEGYITKGIVIDEIIQKKLPQYTITLEQVIKPNITKDSKKINYTTIKLANCFILNGATATNNMSGKKLDESKYIDLLKNSMDKWGFNIMGLNSFAEYSEKGQIPDLLLSGEITHLAYGTRGTGGFKISLLINWSVYDMTKKEVIYNVTTAGYSHTGVGEAEQLTLTLQDALIGLMTDEEFVSHCSK